MLRRLFLLGTLAGFAGVLAGAHFYPWVVHERLAAATSVVPNGGRAETFIVRLPVDRIARVASGGGEAGLNFPAGVEAPPDLAGAPVSLEQFKLRSTSGAVIGVASRHFTETPDGAALAWLLAIPGRGTLMLSAPAQSGDVVDTALGERGVVPGRARSGALEIAAVAEPETTRTLAASDEFRGLDMRFTETWSITGVSEAGELRGTIVLDTIARRGS